VVRSSIRAALALLLCLAPPGAQAQERDGRADLLERAAMSRAKGSERAPVTVFEIADFQCPYCAEFAADVFPRIDEEFIRTGRVQWVFVNLPLPNHRQAWAAAEAALCAGAVAGRFWTMHDRLFEAQAAWSSGEGAARLFSRYAREAGVPQAEYDRCVAEDSVAPLILQDVLGASASEIGATPTFIVNREQKVVGLQSFEEWKELLERAEARAQ